MYYSHTFLLLQFEYLMQELDTRLVHMHNEPSRIIIESGLCAGYPVFSCFFFKLRQYFGHLNLPLSSDRPKSNPYVLLLERTQGREYKPDFT